MGWFGSFGFGSGLGVRGLDRNKDRQLCKPNDNCGLLTRTQQFRPEQLNLALGLASISPLKAKTAGQLQSRPAVFLLLGLRSLLVELNRVAQTLYSHFLFLRR